ncbi:MAG: DUF6884 domain-containing protein [Caldisphaera sp.]|uniref:DUF6884 domain-containing protein n=1 Tax=Caldisphaera sp. TaxID=2060322 RepID=UPI003D09E940
MDYKEKFGILSHAYTSPNFRKLFSDFSVKLKIGDSGIFVNEKISYIDLFKRYEEMDVDYGIIKDYFRDRKKTFQSAKLALDSYKDRKYSFKLIGVAQGNSISEYIQSYSEQKELGFEIVAIGGLLEKIEKHTHMIRVKNDIMLKNVLFAIKEIYPNDKLFPLGTFSKRRIQFFNQLNVWASDYKGWIFRYNKNQASLENNRFKQVRRYLIENVLNPLQQNNELKLYETKTKTYDNEKKLLIMACGKTKKELPGKAINVYDGPSFKIVRNYLKSGNNHLDIKIISAKYGLIDYRDKIIPYDMKLDTKSAEIYKVAFRSNFKDYSKKYEKIFILGGRTYQVVVPDEVNAVRAYGKIGEQLSQLKNWLNDEKD